MVPAQSPDRHTLRALARQGKRSKLPAEGSGIDNRKP